MQYMYYSHLSLSILYIHMIYIFMHMYLSETEVPTILVGLSSFPPLYMTIVWGDRGHNFRRTQFATWIYDYMILYGGFLK